VVFPTPLGMMTLFIVEIYREIVMIMVIVPLPTFSRPTMFQFMSFGGSNRRNLL